MTKAIALMNFPGSYALSTRERLFQSEISWVYSKAGIKPSDALFIPYAYKGNDYPAFLQEVTDIFARSGVHITDIQSGDPAALIVSANAIIICGGDILSFKTRMDNLITPAFNPYLAISNRVANGAPYIGWNEGAAVISPQVFQPPANTLYTGINASLPFQIVTNFQNTNPQSRPSVKNYLDTYPAINKVICQVDQQGYDGSSVRLEDSGAGMIDSATAPYPIVIGFQVINGHLVES